MTDFSKADKIISKIIEDSDREAEEILEKGREKANAILAEAKSQAKIAEDELLQKGNRDAELIKQRIIANAKLQVKKHRLDTKEEVIQQAFSEAEKKLMTVASSKDYSLILRSLISEGVKTLGAKDVEVVVRKEDMKLADKAFLSGLNEELGIHVSLSSNSIESLGGAVIRAKDGKVEVNNTFETRLLRMRDDLRNRAAKILFEE